MIFMKSILLPVLTLLTLVRNVLGRNVTWDKYSLSLDGERSFIFSGEWHYYRLPSPDLWTDVFQKFKAAGMNSISIYFAWVYHSSAPGIYDFTGIRDVDRVLKDAKSAGLNVIARPGPFINAETNFGGWAGWTNSLKLGRDNSSTSYAAWSEWLDEIDHHLVANQYTDNNGSVILVQAENEFTDSGIASEQYMAAIEDKFRADGITVPTTHNNLHRNSDWVQGLGAVNVSGFDQYPNGFNCTNFERWAPVQLGYNVTHATGFPNSPLYMAEFQGGSINYWGEYGFQQCYQLTNEQFIRVFYKNNLAAGSTMQNYYMLQGGTSWGYLRKFLPKALHPTLSQFIEFCWHKAFPGVYTSYDYGSAITESRMVNNTKYNEMKLLGHFLQSVKDIYMTDILPYPSPASNAAIYIQAMKNPASGAQFYTVRHNDSTSTALTTGFYITISKGRDGSEWTVPQDKNMSLNLNGRDSKIYTATWPFGNGHNLGYSTSEIFYQGSTSGTDLLLLYGPNGEAGETVLVYNATLQPTSNSPNNCSYMSTWDPIGELRLNYMHNGFCIIDLKSDSKHLRLILVDRENTSYLWPRNVQGNSVLVQGPILTRTVEFSDARNSTLVVTGDLNDTSTIEIFAPSTVKALVFNGKRVSVKKTALGTLSGEVAGPPPVKLPQLTNWRYKYETFEKNNNFSDTTWRLANLTSTNIPSAADNPVLQMDDYGFHNGHVWYRGRFNSTGNESMLQISATGGTNHAYSIWLNGNFLGTSFAIDQSNFTISSEQLLTNGSNVISLLLQSMGHDEGKRSMRGLDTAILNSGAEISWRIQGNLGGENIMDPVRGPMNAGGLYGERNGWHLQGYDDHQWAALTLPYNTKQMGVSWFRSLFSLDIPVGVDAPIGIKVSDANFLKSKYRLLIYVNGYMMGIYVNYLGPQKIFYVPEGILNHRGSNQIAIALWSLAIGDTVMPDISLYLYGSFASPLRVGLVDAPSYSEIYESHHH